MVRAGERSRLFHEFKKDNIVAIGFSRVGDLTKANKPDEVKETVREYYPEWKPGQINSQAGQLNRFKFEFQIDDWVVTYSQEERIYLVGKFTSEYKYDKSREEYHHYRKVKWEGEVPRDIVSTSSKNSLGAISTLFEISGTTKEEMLNLLKGKKTEQEDLDSQEAEMDSIKEDLKDKAFEFIKDKVLNLSWEESQELVAGVLRAMNYRTIISLAGPDRGKDIIASPDGLGLEDPRIIVEVKHRRGQMGATEIRSFLGGLRRGSKGLYVSTGGFTKDANYEAERSDIPLTLVTLDLLVELIIQYYDHFDEEAKTLIPLDKIYWPA
jgi:restriction system protein